MTRFVATTELPASARDAWDLLTDWPAHSRWIPLTRVRVLTPLATGVGARFVGRTSLAVIGLDRIGFDDPMQVTEWRPPTGPVPARCSVRKLGRTVRGSATFEVSAVAGPEHRCRVVWDEDIVIAPRALTRLIAPLVSLAGRLAFTGMLKSMGRELAKRSGGS